MDKQATDSLDIIESIATVNGITVYLRCTLCDEDFTIVDREAFTKEEAEYNAWVATNCPCGDPDDTPSEDDKHLPCDLQESETIERWREGRTRA